MTFWWGFTVFQKSAFRFESVDEGLQLLFNDDDVHFMSHASGTFVLQLQRRVLRDEEVCMSASIVSFSFIRHLFLVFIAYLNLYRGGHTYTRFANTKLCEVMTASVHLILLYKLVYFRNGFSFGGCQFTRNLFSFSLTLRLSAYIVSLLRGTWQRTVNWNNRLRHSCCRS